MLPEQKELIFKHFHRLVQECDLQRVLHVLVNKGALTQDEFGEIDTEEDKFHNNRRILFKLLKYDKLNIFGGFVDALKETGSTRLAAVLDNRLEAFALNNFPNPLDIVIDVKFSTQFYDSAHYNKTKFYSTRSKNRGHVLIINNIKFSKGLEERHGAETDELQLKTLFETMGLRVFIHRNLTDQEMLSKVKEFSQDAREDSPDMGFVIVMSHGMIYNHQPLIVDINGKPVPESHFQAFFYNDNCALFRKKPKIFMYHVCRQRNFYPAISETMTDANLVRHRTYSDMLICHPSVEGFAAHRNTEKGSWYILMLCKVFMNHAHDMDVESMLKKIDEELEVVSSMPWPVDDINHSTEQTSTFQNIAFKACYIHPGIYEENHKIMQFTHN